MKISLLTIFFDKDINVILAHGKSNFYIKQRMHVTCVAQGLSVFWENYNKLGICGPKWTNFSGFVIEIHIISKLI